MRLKTESTYYRSCSNLACSLGYPGLCGQQILVTETDMAYCVLVAPSCDHYHSLLTDVAIFSYASLNFLHLSLLVAAFSQLSSLSPTCLPFVLPGYLPAPCSLPTSNNLYQSSLFNIAILNYVASPSHSVFQPLPLLFLCTQDGSTHPLPFSADNSHFKDDNRCALF